MYFFKIRSVRCNYIFYLQNESDHGYGRNKNKTFQNTKKMDCPAQIAMREVMLFPEYQVTDYTLFHLIVSPHPVLYQVLNAKLE